MIVITVPQIYFYSINTQMLTSLILKGFLDNNNNNNNNNNYYY